MDQQILNYSAIILDETAGQFRLTLNRPDQLNSLNQAMQEEIAHALSRIEQAHARALVISGAGRAFCAGQDLSERNVEDPELDLGRGPELYYNPLIRRLMALRCPVICAVNGVAAGAGVNIALACDLVIAKRSSRFVQAFASIGLVPDAGGSWTLPKLVGQARAMAFTMLGETWSAEQAQAYGMIWRAVEDDQFAAEVDAIAAKLAAAPTHGLASAKRALHAGWTTSLSEALDLERDLQRACGRSDDYREGVTAFKQKRAAQFSGR